MTGPLNGIRMLELAVFHNGPAAGYMLGDLGAEIIKIEDRIHGDYTRGIQSLWGSAMDLKHGLNISLETANRSKKSINLDLKKEKGREVLYRLVKKSDVFYTNFSKRVTTELGVDYPTLCKHNPAIIYATATGYGAKGAEADNRAFDIVAQARSGLMASVGEAGSPPAQIVGAVIDQAGATMLAYGILAALVARERTGIGQEVEASLLGAAMHLQVLNVNACLLRGRPMARVNRAKTRNPMANHYKCADGKWLLLGELDSNRFWSPFCRAVGAENLENDPRFNSMEARRENCEELISIMDGIFATKTRDEWVSILKEKGGGLAFSVIYDLSEAVTDPQTLANDYVVDFNHPVLGPIKVIGFPASLSKTPAAISRKAPEFGEHTEEVLTEVAGYSWEEVGALREQEVI